MFTHPRRDTYETVHGVANLVQLINGDLIVGGKRKRIRDFIHMSESIKELKKALKTEWDHLDPETKNNAFKHIILFSAAKYGSYRYFTGVPELQRYIPAGKIRDMFNRENFANRLVNNGELIVISAGRRHNKFHIRCNPKVRKKYLCGKY